MGSAWGEAAANSRVHYCERHASEAAGEDSDLPEGSRAGECRLNSKSLLAIPTM